VSVWYGDELSLPFLFIFEIKEEHGKHALQDWLVLLGPEDWKKRVGRYAPKSK
jgi:hypothetical protein